MKKLLVPFFAILFLTSCEMESMNDVQPELDNSSKDLLSEGTATDMLNTQMRLEQDLEASTEVTDQSVLPPSEGCALTPGYWKTHSEFGPAPYDETWALLSNGASTPFYLSGATWLEVFNTPPAGNAYYQLAHQFMAATLNILGGADQSAVSAEFNTAMALFTTYTPGQVASLSKSSPVRAQMLALASTFDNYNNGIIGPGNCN